MASLPDIARWPRMNIPVYVFEYGELGAGWDGQDDGRDMQATDVTTAIRRGKQQP